MRHVGTKSRRIALRSQFKALSYSRHRIPKRKIIVTAPDILLRLRAVIRMA